VNVEELERRFCDTNQDSFFLKEVSSKQQEGASKTIGSIISISRARGSENFEGKTQVGRYLYIHRGLMKIEREIFCPLLNP
jgi:hypothetical protein